MCTTCGVPCRGALSPSRTGQYVCSSKPGGCNELRRTCTCLVLGWPASRLNTVTSSFMVVTATPVAIATTGCGSGDTEEDI